MRKILSFIIILLALVILGCVSDDDNSPSSVSYKSPVYKTYNQNIANGVVPVEAGGYIFYKFSIPSQASISGDFTAFGGSGNDIIVIILDETAYINWINGHSVSTYYNSGKMTTGNINTNLPAGNYYLIYSNIFSSFSDKNVKTNVDASYKICIENC